MACGHWQTGECKRGQFLAPVLGGIVDKVAGPVMLTGGHYVWSWRPRRGLSRAVDASHGCTGVLRRDARRATTGGHGRRREVAPLARAARPGIDALFVETHPSPAHARSDAGSQVPLAQLYETLAPVVEIHRLLARARRQP